MSGRPEASGAPSGASDRPTIPPGSKEVCDCFELLDALDGGVQGLLAAVQAMQASQDEVLAHQAALVALLADVRWYLRAATGILGILFGMYTWRLVLYSKNHKDLW